MPPILLVDTSFVAHKAMFALPSFTARSNGEPSEIVFSVLNTVLRLGKAYHTNRFVFAMDSRNSVRRDAYPNYKAKRGEKDDPIQQKRRQLMGKQLGALPDLLNRIGFTNVHRVDGFEADDIIASFVRCNRFIEHGKRPLYVISSDHDLYQVLLYPQVQGMDTLDRNKPLYTHMSFAEEFDSLSPASWNWVKAAAGCSSDNVEGLSGIGEKRAVDYVLDRLPKESRYYNAIRSDMSLANAGKSVIVRNIELVTLPHRKFPEARVFGKGDPFKADHFSRKGFLSVCEEYGFASFVNTRIDDWRTFFRGTWSA